MAISHHPNITFLPEQPYHTNVISEPIRPGRPHADRREAWVYRIGEQYYRPNNNVIVKSEEQGLVSLFRIMDLA